MPLSMQEAFMRAMLAPPPRARLLADFMPPRRLFRDAAPPPPSAWAGRLDDIDELRRAGHLRSPTTRAGQTSLLRQILGDIL